MIEKAADPRNQIPFWELRDKAQNVKGYLLADSGVFTEKYAELHQKIWDCFKQSHLLYIPYEEFMVALAKIKATMTAEIKKIIENDGIAVQPITTFQTKTFPIEQQVPQKRISYTYAMKGNIKSAKLVLHTLKKSQKKNKGKDDKWYNELIKKSLIAWREGDLNAINEVKKYRNTLIGFRDKVCIERTLLEVAATIHRFINDPSISKPIFCLVDQLMLVGKNNIRDQLQKKKIEVVRVPL